jgi:hypothetical protein
MKMMKRLAVAAAVVVGLSGPSSVTLGAGVPLTAYSLSPTATVAADGLPHLAPGVGLTWAATGGQPPIVLSNGDVVAEVQAAGTGLTCENSANDCVRYSVEALSPSGHLLWTYRVPKDYVATAAVWSGRYIGLVQYSFYVTTQAPELVLLTLAGQVAKREVLPEPPAISGSQQGAGTLLGSSDGMLFTYTASQPPWYVWFIEPDGAVLRVMYQAFAEALASNGQTALIARATTIEAVAVVSGRILWHEAEPTTVDSLSHTFVGPYVVSEWVRSTNGTFSMQLTVSAMTDGAVLWSRTFAQWQAGSPQFGPVAEGGAIFVCQSPVLAGKSGAPACTAYRLATGAVLGTTTLPVPADSYADLLAASPAYLVVRVAEGPWSACPHAVNTDCHPAKTEILAVPREITGKAITAAAPLWTLPYVYNLGDGTSVVMPVGHNEEWVF